MFRKTTGIAGPGISLPIQKSSLPICLPSTALIDELYSLIRADAFFHCVVIPG